MNGTEGVSRRSFLRLLGVGATMSVLAACAPAAAPADAPAAGAPTAATAAEAAPAVAAGKLEIFSWWTSGGEVGALQALYDIYSREYPDVEVINAALAGGTGQGGDMKALLETRMMGGQPPESFQVHLGRELIDSHVVADRMEPLDDLFAEAGFNDVFPKDLLEIASYEGSPWSVPVNIHRANVLWYRPSKLEAVGATEPPKDWDEFFALADKLKEAGIPAIAIAGADGNFNGHVLETILIATMGPDDWRGLFNGSITWDDERVTQGLEILNKLWDYTLPDYLSITWGDINDRFVGDEGPAMMIMGDWTHGVLKSMGFADYKWAASPGTDGVFDMLSDSFGLPKGVQFRDNAVNWLKVCGSKEGQDAFNPIKGSIPARTDADLSVYDEYQLSAMDDWKSNTLVPSLQHGAAAKQSFLLDYDLAVNNMLASRDVATAQADMVTAAEEAEFGK